MPPSSNGVYDPRMVGLIWNSKEDWGSIEDNLANILPYGIKQLDDAFNGVDYSRGELNSVVGRRKSRKSTTMLNFVRSFCINTPGFRDGKPQFWTSMDVLESGMLPGAYRDAMLAMNAAAFVIADYFGIERGKWPGIREILSTMLRPEHRTSPEDRSTLTDVLTFDKDFWRYRYRTAYQESVEARAKKAQAQFPISIFGSPKDQGSSRDLVVVLARWEQLYEGTYIHKTRGGQVDMRGIQHRIFVIDPMSQVARVGDQYFGSSHYDRQEVVTGRVAEFITMHPESVAFIVSHQSVSGVRDEARGFGPAGAKGGDYLVEESVVALGTKYEETKDPYNIEISMVATRKRPAPTILQPIEPNSGLFVGPATVKMRKGA